MNAMRQSGNNANDPKKTSDKFSAPATKRSRWARPSSAADVIGGVVQKRNWSNRLHDARIFTAFASAAGEQTAGHAKGVRFKAGELTVSVDSAGWRQQLQLMSDSLIARTNALLPEAMVRSLRLTHGAAPVYDPAPPVEVARPPPPPPTHEALEAADRLSHLVADGDVASSVARLYLAAHSAKR